MSTRKHSDAIITNQKTLLRRAWIDRALHGARRAGASAEDLLEAAGEKPARPQLSVVGAEARR